MSHATVVAGEAPETDSEDDMEEDGRSTAIFDYTDVAGRTRHFYRKGDRRKQSRPEKQSPKYSSLLHTKLHDSQLGLCKSADEFYKRQTQPLIRQLRQVAGSMTSNQRVMQETSYNMRAVTETLYKLDKSIDTVLCSSQYIPNLEMTTAPSK